MFCELPQILREANALSAAARLLLALLCGGVIGFDRGRHGRPAGLRTYMLVCMGSALAMLVGEYVYGVYGTGDPSRIAAQVVSGIGFLGVGTIIVTGGRQVKGLTTAAGLWAAACIGLAAGCGFYEAALLAALLAYLTIRCLKAVDKRVLGKRETVTFYVELEPQRPLSVLLIQLRARGCRMVDLELRGDVLDPEAGLAALMTVALSREIKKSEAEELFGALEGIRFLETVL